MDLLHPEGCCHKIFSTNVELGVHNITTCTPSSTYHLIVCTRYFPWHILFFPPVARFIFEPLPEVYIALQKYSRRLTPISYMHQTRKLFISARSSPSIPTAVCCTAVNDEFPYLALFKPLIEFELKSNVLEHHNVNVKLKIFRKAVETIFNDCIRHYHRHH